MYAKFLSLIFYNFCMNFLTSVPWVRSLDRGGDGNDISITHRGSLERSLEARSGCLSLCPMVASFHSDLACSSYIGDIHVTPLEDVKYARQCMRQGFMH
jgi:hypothetical protein